MEPPPPTPVRANSEVIHVNTAEIAASKAFPPEARIDIPTDDAIGWLDVTTPCDADIDCFRVIKSIELKYNN